MNAEEVLTAEEAIDAWIDPCGSDTGAGILTALKSEGYAVVQLPDREDFGTDNEGGWWAMYPNAVGLVMPSQSVLFRGASMRPTEAREVAVALLAAAAAAEVPK